MSNFTPPVHLKEEGNVFDAALYLEAEKRLKSFNSYRPSEFTTPIGS